jgi:hypothetical protein
MHQRAAQLIHALRLESHPEGGHYREVFRSSTVVLPEDGRDGRPALTSIYFLLAGGTHSKWHLVHSDEVWHHLEGDPLELIVVNPASLDPRTLVLGSRTRGARPIQVVPAGHWQAARTIGDYTLVGCTVGPGFVFEDFQLLRNDGRAASTVRDKMANLAYML